ncbi:GT2 family glycosyltransferase [Crossiella equi]|uniref:GT2 family glycosyltransferase n=1 Tax=Crossiella equi TaxID=130796 RepID=A0ABS5ADD4_9PSEU|nr:glycosyltransferase family 2 protein [Crossiella equi]MBP2474588.1 GT2 family glycosyltransferase [Crossiella equi]
MPVAPQLSTAPVLAVLVCHDGAEWLRPLLSALRRQTVRPRHVLAVDTGSTDDTARLLAAAATGPDQVLDGVLTLPRDTGFGAAVAEAVDTAVARWGDPGAWLWLLHDDCAPEPDCLPALLAIAELAPSAAVLGPLAVDWADPRLVVQGGLSLDASGHTQTGISGAELAAGDGFDQARDVLAVGTAGALIRREVWAELGGLDPELRLGGEDVDFGWRANLAGHLVLLVPAARLRHARAAERDLRPVHAERNFARARRAHGLRTFLVNTSWPSFLCGLPRLVFLCLLRALGFLLLRRMSSAGDELAAVGYLFSGRAGLLAARRVRAATRTVSSREVRGLFTSRLTRVRNAVRGGLLHLLRSRARADAALGRLPVDPLPEWTEPGAPPRRSGPPVLPAGALGPSRRRGRIAPAGLRRPAGPVVVEVEEYQRKPSPRPRPTPYPRGRERTEPELVLVELDQGRLVRELLLSPVLFLVLGLLVLAAATHWARFGGDLAGGRLLPFADLAETWAGYVATWQPVGGGSIAPAPVAAGVFGVLGALLGGPGSAAAVVLLFDLPLAGLAAYLATRRLRASRPVRAAVAAGYALLPVGTAAVAQGRLDVVVAHLLLPPVLAGVAAVLWPRRRDVRWLSVTSGTALALAVLGAFQPLAQLVVVLAVLAGFVLIPGGGGRRIAALCTLVLLPLAVQLPWPATVVGHPALLLHGVGAPVREDPARLADVLALHPGGPGALPWLGGVLVLAALAAVLLRPRRAMLPAAAVLALGVVATAVVALVPVSPLNGGPMHPGWTGAPLLFVGCGLALLVLAAALPGPPPRLPVRALAVAATVVLAALSMATLVVGRQGPLRSAGPVLVASQVEELADGGSSVLEVGATGQPTRQVAGRLPRFGDDDVVLVPAAARRLADWTAALRLGSPEQIRETVLAAAAGGVRFLLLPEEATAIRIRLAAPDLVATDASATDGRPVLRLPFNRGPVVLLAGEAALRARTGATPTGPVEAAPVAARPPEVAVAVSEGSLGRVLVLAAEDERGWVATVNGREVPLARAYGHLVAVAVPESSAEIRVTVSGLLPVLLLLAQAALALFTALTAIPGRR